MFTKAQIKFIIACIIFTKSKAPSMALDVDTESLMFKLQGQLK